MKLFTGITLALLFAVSSLAQDAMPTKEETVNYLNKKLKEVDGRFWLNAGEEVRFSNISVRQNDEYLELKYSESGPGVGRVNEITNLINPAHITKIIGNIGVPNTDTVKYFEIVSSAKTIRRRCCDANSRFEDLRDTRFPYFAGDPANLVKITKALLHLRDLAKAEDDLF